MTDYWRDCVAEACEDAGLPATDDQIDTLASWVEGAHDNYGMAHGHDAGLPRTILESEHDTKVRNMEQVAQHDREAADRREKDLRWRIRDLENTIFNLREDLRRARAA